MTIAVRTDAARNRYRAADRAAGLGCDRSRGDGAASSVTPNSTARTARRSRSGPDRWIRFALWIVAVPLAFLIVFGWRGRSGSSRPTTSTDVALAEGWHRFWPIVRLLPFVAVATAGLVHGGVYGITRLREAGEVAKRRTGREVGGRSETGSGVEVGQSSGSGA